MLTQKKPKKEKKMINREELERALEILQGDFGHIYPACALTNPESSGHSAVLHALCVVMEDELFDDYRDVWEWDYMDAEERAKFGDAGDDGDDFVNFTYECNSYNYDVIERAIKIAKEKLGL
jgi:hypothetical protein